MSIHGFWLRRQQEDAQESGEREGVGSRQRGRADAFRKAEFTRYGGGTEGQGRSRKSEHYKEQAADQKRSSSPREETSQSWLKRSEASLATYDKPCCG